MRKTQGNLGDHMFFQDDKNRFVVRHVSNQYSKWSEKNMKF